ncbi:hypothetical protein [Pectobacterium colocasium]
MVKSLWFGAPRGALAAKLHRNGERSGSEGGRGATGVDNPE